MPVGNPIPSFKSPPLGEVLLGVQFDAIQSFNITTYGALWEIFKEKFSVIEHHMPLDPSFEKIGGRMQSLADLSRIKLQQFDSAPLPRAWFISTDGQDLVQVQADRFIRNWRRRDVSDQYPRYEEHMRPEFSDNIKLLDSFYVEHGMGALQPNQCEISYINHIDINRAHSLLSKVFVGWSEQYDLSEIASVEDIQLNIKHIVKENDDFVGRLYVKLQPAFKAKDDKPIFLLELTLKGRPLGEGLNGVMKFMDMGRDKIVRAFDRMTTKYMHDLWGKE